MLGCLRWGVEVAAQERPELPLLIGRLFLVGLGTLTWTGQPVQSQVGLIEVQ